MLGANDHCMVSNGQSYVRKAHQLLFSMSLKAAVTCMPGRLLHGRRQVVAACVDKLMDCHM
jgi:hypothetical protein